MFDHQRLDIRRIAVLWYDLHVVIIPSDGERKAAFDLLIFGFRVWILKRAACEHGLLETVERNGAKFLPVTDELILDDDLMNCQLALGESSISEH